MLRELLLNQFGGPQNGERRINAEQPTRFFTPRKVVQAANLIRKGKVYHLGRVYEEGMPLFGNRHYSLTIVSFPSGGPLGKNQLVWHDEMFSGEIGQIGTQFDRLGHIGTRVGRDDIFYNGFKRSDFSKAYGLEKLGVEQVGVFFTRGVLVDVADFKGVDKLKVGYVISVSDIEGTLKKTGCKSLRGRCCVIPYWSRETLDGGQSSL